MIPGIRLSFRSARRHALAGTRTTFRSFTRDLPARDLPARDLPARDLPARDLPARDLPARDLRGWRPGQETEFA
jgi:hypothetical protein